MTFWPLDPYHKSPDSKTWLTESFSEALPYKLSNKKNYMSPKLREMKLNWIFIHPYWFQQKSSTASSTGEPHEIHGEKIQQYHVSKIMRFYWSKTAKQFAVNSYGESLYLYQASRQARTWPLGFLSHIFRYFLALQVFWSNILYFLYLADV